MKPNTLFCKGAWSLLPLLLTPALLLIPLLYFQWDKIEQTVKANTQILLGKEYEWVSIHTFNRGRDVVLTGIAPSAQAAEEVKKIALQANGTRTVNFVGGVQIKPGKTKTEITSLVPVAMQTSAIKPIVIDTPPCEKTLADLLANSKIMFASGSSTIDNASDELLQNVANTLTHCPTLDFEVAGHTDSIGNALANQQVSENRAEAVINRLVDFGLDRKRFTAIGYGADRPIADNTLAEGRAENRRIEFKAITKGE